MDNDFAKGELALHVESIGNAIDPSRKADAHARIQSICLALRHIHSLIVGDANSQQIRNAFRHLDGFELLLRILRSFTGYLNAPNVTLHDKAEFMEMLKLLMQVLSEALCEHSGNRRYFAQRIEGDGWRVFREGLLACGIGSSAPKDEDRQWFAQFFGLLFGFALSDDTFTVAFKDHTVPSDPAAASTTHTQNIEASVLERLFHGNETLCNPEIMPTIIVLWKSLLCHADSSYTDLATAVLTAVLMTATLSIRNAIKAHQTGLLSLLLPFALGIEQGVHPRTCSVARKLCHLLLTHGINNLDDARLLFREARNSEAAAGFLLEVLQHQGPPFIQFDLSLHGYSSVELPALGRPFPPANSGYTISTWIRIDRLDKNIHTTLFGGYDQSQTSFILVYLEKDSQQLILQTSVTANRPSVRFKSMDFREKEWYHVVLVHERPRTKGTSNAHLYVNGRYMEKQRALWPARAPTSAGPDGVPRSAAVQIILGTPQDLALRIGRDVWHARWSLAALHLIYDTLNADVIQVLRHLGPRYSGNFQDILATFMTYRDSTILNCKNEEMHAGDDGNTYIAKMSRQKAGSIIPEHAIALSFSPSAVLELDRWRQAFCATPTETLSKEACKNFSRSTRAGNQAIMLNAASLSINAALARSSGIGILTGSPVVSVPQHLDDASWRLAGSSALGLKLVELARTKESVLRATQILFASLSSSWRNSEAMERDGYQVLATILRGKLGINSVLDDVGTLSYGRIAAVAAEAQEELALELLRSILRFVGYDEKQPGRSLLNNALAYRILLMDFDTWRTAPIATQKLYYDQLLHFASQDCTHHNFNARRLVRMRLIKQLLNALKGESIRHDVLPDFLEAFSALLRFNLTGDNLRGLALFITWALETGRPPWNLDALRSPGDGGPSIESMHASSTDTRHLDRPNVTEDIQNVVLPRELGVHILELTTEVVCNTSDQEGIMKFSRSVKMKWLLHQLDEGSDERVIICTIRILFRLLVVQGPEQVRRFQEAHGGFTLLRHKLRSWWNTPTIWTLLFALLFQLDPASIDLEQDFNVFTLSGMFIRSDSQVHIPEVFPVLTGMLESGIQELKSSSARTETEHTAPEFQSSKSDAHASLMRGRSMSLQADKLSRASSRSSAQRLAGDADVLTTVIGFLQDLFTESLGFREWAARSNYVQQLLFVLYPAVIGGDQVSAETELLLRAPGLGPDGKQILARRSRSSENTRPAYALNSNTDVPGVISKLTAASSNRAPSFLASSTRRLGNSSLARLSTVMSETGSLPVQLRVSNGIAERILTLVNGVFVEQVLHRKDFVGFGLFLKVPPGHQQQQAYFESFVLQRTIAMLSSQLRLNTILLSEPRVITNLSRFAQHMAEAFFEGWFAGHENADSLLDLLGQILEMLKKPEVRARKSVRLCVAAVGALEHVFMRIMLAVLSSIDELKDEVTAIQRLAKITFWQPVILSCENALPTVLRLIVYQLYIKSRSPVDSVRIAALDFWRSLLVQKPEDASTILMEAFRGERRILGRELMDLTVLDNESFTNWVRNFDRELDALFAETLAKEWDHFVGEQDRETEKTAQNRLNKRREKLKAWNDDDTREMATIRNYDRDGSHWRRNIYVSERLKHQRILQDQQDNMTHTATALAKLDRLLKGACSLFEPEKTVKWRLDETEGEHRMRLRILPDRAGPQDDYKPKRKSSHMHDGQTVSGSRQEGSTASGRSTINPMIVVFDQDKPVQSQAPSTFSQQTMDTNLVEDDFEIVEDPKHGDDGFEDKNRRVLRALERGDQVESIFNVSRIVALEACEGILVFGKACLYLIDNFLQRADGEVVRIWQATPDERDPYLQLLPDQDTKRDRPKQPITNQTRRHWRWQDVMVVSKRSFLLRDVALELFFTDGRSYLLTARSKTERNELYSRLADRAPHLNSASTVPFMEDAWRLDSWRNPKEINQGLLARISMVSPRAATKLWQAGEMSNFHYLMLLNTMAGRTFNDLTQYPVFPWILADYTSDELDLTNPGTFRDLSRPMGCQTPGADAQARERYLALKEMGIEPGPYHFSTHYSSATTVSSYLVRLQPFVQAYVAVQGGKFDVADRMFGSVKGAWEGASGINAQDVRELTPEFFCLPDFLLNQNHYDFGTLANGQKLDHVTLPPWAHGSPEIFVRKHREALESPFVSMHLHRWVDLVFGCKQTGQAAIDSLNLFHPYSYAGARDLDEVQDAATKKSMANIIHSFGQTPMQIFTRPHPSRDELASPYSYLDMATAISKEPMALLNIHERVAHMHERQGRLRCSSTWRLHIPPLFDRYVEWGFVDNSLRFFTDDGKRQLGVFEHLHIGHPSAVMFADSRTLVTAGMDCAVSVWNVEHTSKDIKIVLHDSLFGHRRPVNLLASSNRFMTLLSGDMSGRLLMWDLNNTDFVRELVAGGPEIRMARISNATGNILLACGKRVKVFSLNGTLLLDQHLCDADDDEIMCLAWVEARKHEWLERTLFVTGHRLGFIRIWEMITTRDGTWALTFIESLSISTGASPRARRTVTSVLPVGSTIYAGDDEGQVVSFSIKRADRI